MAINESLFEQVKRKLNITWNDDDTTTRIEEIIDSAIPDMIRLLGIADVSFDFSIPSKERTLFLNYCLYEWNHCLNEFQDNYSNDIAQVRDKHMVEQYQESEEVSTDEQ